MAHAIHKSQKGAVSGSLVVIVLLALIAAVGGGLIWYKQQPQALPPALNNSQGVMLLIPAGPFPQGPNREQAVVPAFYIDRIEVTNRMYGEFCHATQRPLPPDFPSTRPDDPVVNVTISDAATYAKWADKRLPDAIEWEKAYRGTTGRLYPWGDDADPTKANVADNAKLTEHKRLIADSMTEGGSPYNILQMAGNVAEYIRTLSPPTPADVDRLSRVMNPAPTAKEGWYGAKGGSYDQPLEAVVPWSYTAVPDGYRAPNLGFRCVKDPPRR